MKREYIPVLLALIVIFSMPFSIAAGSGAGGSDKPSESPKPTCSEDTWTCSEWGDCVNDAKTRSCTLTNDCASANTPMPKESETCAKVDAMETKLKCTSMQTAKERIACRLDLKEEDIDKELKMAYLPEECRTIQNKTARQDCVLLYARSQKCWAKPIGDERADCIKEVLEIKDLKEEKRKCGNDNNCASAVKRKAYGLIKFRLYDLEERASSF